MLDKVSIRLDLTGNMAERFLELKAKRGLKNSTELMRQLITEAIQKKLPRG